MVLVGITYFLVILVEEAVFKTQKQKMEEVDYEPPKFSDLSLNSEIGIKMPDDESEGLMGRSLKGTSL